MAIYMKYGKNVKGSVTTEQFKDWIELYSFQWSAGRSITLGVGKGYNRQGSSPSVSECTVTKVLDAATHGELADVFWGALDTTAEIHFTQTDEENYAYLQIELTNTGISSYSISSGGDRPLESLSLNFTKIMMTNFKVSDDGLIKMPDRFVYDLRLMKGSG